ncbi:uncharacterized protein LOC113563736 [Drosophila erecta]|uniref:uncharacterized protein LOC113563736 n=1 Tax=Drosophila erecta TaxID=7220 RepID=UPI000F06C91F|nr:uncharacterized protein LOC113563736 [Drosophila erecta]
MLATDVGWQGYGVVWSITAMDESVCLLPIGCAGRTLEKFAGTIPSTIKRDVPEISRPFVGQLDAREPSKQLPCSNLAWNPWTDAKEQMERHFLCAMARPHPTASSSAFNFF